MTRGARHGILAGALLFSGCQSGLKVPGEGQMEKVFEQQITRARHGHILTNTGVWSPDSEWIAYDVRSDAAGEKFDGTRIEAVNIRTGEVKVLFESRNGANCGVVTFHPRQARVVFILGPENPTPEWSYGPSHRQGMMVDFAEPGVARPLDGRDITAPFTAGALRGGSHVHVWDASGEWVSFTYEDAVIGAGRNVGVSVPVKKVTVSREQPRNHDGDYFSVLATRTTGTPKAGSDEIERAFEEGWIGREGYLRSDGVQVRHAVAFQGQVITEKGETISEVFISDLPDDVTRAGDAPLEGTESSLPAPPLGTIQRRVTFTAGRPYPGIQGPRHWLRSSPDGTRIAFLMKDGDGIAQLWTVSPNGGTPRQVTRNPWPIGSAFTWSQDGRWIAHTMDNSVFLTDAESGRSRRLTARTLDADAPRPEACVFSPDGRKIAYVRAVKSGTEMFNQVFVANVP